MKIMDLDGKVIEVGNLDLALMQADDYRHFRHAKKGFEHIDERLQRYWEDVYQKLFKLKEAGGQDG
jgi:tetrahydromethanopterin S-methyltransferase subunit G